MPRCQPSQLERLAEGCQPHIENNGVGAQEVLTARHDGTDRPRSSFALQHHNSVRMEGRLIAVVYRCEAVGFIAIVTAQIKGQGVVNAKYFAA